MQVVFIPAGGFRCADRDDGGQRGYEWMIIGPIGHVLLRIRSGSKHPYPLASV
jgi:hypothetical protein